MTRRALLIGLPLLTCCSGLPEKPVTTPSGKYLGQPVPGDTPKPFATGVVNTKAIELNSVFSPDGKEFFFDRVFERQFTIFHSVLGAKGWSTPTPMLLFPNGDRALAVDMAVSPDGTELFFLGEYPHKYASESPGNDLWVSRRVEGAWTTAQVVPPPVRTPLDEIYVTVVHDGSLYFSSNRARGADGKNDLYRAQRLADGGFAEPVLIGAPIQNEAGIGDTFVAPDESYMVFSSRRLPSEGRGDLFCSFHQPDGSWSEPRNLGPTINSAEHEYCPMVTPDGAYLFFSRRYGDTWETTKDGDVFWVDARVIERLRTTSTPK